MAIRTVLARVWLGMTMLMVPAHASAPEKGAIARETSDLATPQSLIDLDAWNDPPREVRPIARWWWPGGSVESAGIRSSLQQMRDAGFGAVEVQPLLLGLGDAELAADPKLRSVGTPGFGRSLAEAAAAAEALGLDFDLTLGSGWPGGLPTAKINSERQLLMGTLDVTGPLRFEGALPAAPDQSYRQSVEWVLDVLGPADRDVRRVGVLAGRLAGERDGVPVVDEVIDLDDSAKGDRLEWDVPPGRWRIFALYENSTGHFVMGGAFPGSESDALVVDHLSRRGADALLDGYAAPMLGAIEPAPVHGVFVDSFELMGELPFSSGFLAAFEARTGYDLTPHLPTLFVTGGESKYAEMMDLFDQRGGPVVVSNDPDRDRRVREDYADVRAALFEQQFIGRIADWSRRRGLVFRLQAHGGYGDDLDVYALADVPESEALFAGGSFDFLKLAASAAHVADRRWASSESFITLRVCGTRLDWDEMRLLAGRAYSAGVNRLVFHGVPYPYARADGEAWFPFSGGFGRILAGPLPMSSNFDAAFLEQLPEFNRMLARLSLAMSSGEPVAEVAWLRSIPAHPDTASFQLGRIEARAGESFETGALRARGLVHDRVSPKQLAGAHVSDGQIAIGARRYSALLIDPLETAQPEWVERIAEIAEAGIPVLALGTLPQRAPGLRDAAARDRRVRAASLRLREHVIEVPSPEDLEPLLERHVTQGLVAPPIGERLEVSLDRRTSDRGETLLVFNEAWSEQRAVLRFLHGGGPLTRWDPRTGAHTVLRDRVAPGDLVTLDLAAVETLLLTLGREPAASHEVRVDPSRTPAPTD